jgi:hypothetical protein
MLAAEDLRILVVVEEGEFRSPGDEHGELGAQQEARNRAEALRPTTNVSERRGRPIVRPYERAHLAAPGEEFLFGCTLVRPCVSAQVWSRHSSLPFACDERLDEVLTRLGLGWLLLGAKVWAGLGVEASQ